MSSISHRVLCVRVWPVPSFKNMCVNIVCLLQFVRTHFNPFMCKTVFRF
jgi:hypothetical protein